MLVGACSSRPGAPSGISPVDAAAPDVASGDASSIPDEAAPDGGPPGGPPGKPDGSTPPVDASGGDTSVHFDAGPAPPDPCIEAGTCPPGTWVNVTPAGVSLDPDHECSACNFGAQDIVVDPVNPSDLYAFICYQGVWKSTDYGSTWTKVDTGTNATNLEAGRPWTAAIDPNPARDPSTPPALYTVAGYGSLGGVYKSIDGGNNWSNTLTNNTTAQNATGFSGNDPYSLDIDPYDSLHVIAGFHGAPGVSESIDGGQTWTTVGVPENQGSSLYVFFIGTGTASTTRTTWLSIAQWVSNANGTWLTTNAGGAWTQVSDLEHQHGSAQIFQDGMGDVYAAGVGSTYGVWRSADYGSTWAPASADNVLQNAVFGTAKNLYAMNSFASQGTVTLHDQTSSRTGGVDWNDWTPTSPAGMSNGPKRAAVTFDGVHSVIVAGNWLAGIWRYVEP
jgi:hypothetical protein